MSIFDDNKTIDGLWTIDGCDYPANKSQEIVAVKEAGQMAYVVWFEVYKDKKLIARINGAHVVGVTYI